MEIVNNMKRIFDHANYQLPLGSRWNKMLFWDVTLGCSPCSIGCMRCSSARTVYLNGDEHGIVDDSSGTPLFNEKVIIDGSALNMNFADNEQVFVCGRSDLFHESISNTFIQKVIGHAAIRPDCTFFVLTKRPIRIGQFKWPSHFWVGASIENQQMADSRLSHLTNVKAIRFASIKPCLGPIDLSPYKDCIDAVIVGGEYGPGARPMHKHWVYNIMNWCHANRKPFSFHNWGLWIPGRRSGNCINRRIGIDGMPSSVGQFVHTHLDGEDGTTIDGDTWDEYP